MAAQSVDPAGPSRRVESCPLLMCLCPVSSHHCQTPSLVSCPRPSPSLSLSLSLVLSFCLIFQLSTSLSYLSLPLGAHRPCPLSPRVSNNILPLSATHIFIFSVPKKQMVLLSQLPLFIPISEVSPSLPPVLCFLPSSRCITDPDWPSTCLFCLSPPSLIQKPESTSLKGNETVLLLFTVVISWTWYFSD